MANVLLIFIKNPRLGAVKTRLARTLGDSEALRIYLILLHKTRVAALGTAVERWLFYSDAVAAGDEWPESGFRKFVQSGDDLGSRMEDAFRRAFAAGAGRVVIIGSDCPALSAAVLGEAFRQLDSFDFVLGPASDGGYYLLGMRRLETTVFQEIAWSTASVREQTVAAMEGLGKTCFLLPELSDVDTEEDWARWKGV